MTPTRATARRAPVSKAPKAAKAKAPAARMTLAQTMNVLEKAGSAQTRKTYTRHGCTGPMFGVSFAVLKDLTKKIDVDHELALALWDTGNFDARNLAVKIVDPQRMSAAGLDRWSREVDCVPLCGGYVGMVAGEGPHASRKLEQWSAAKEDAVRCTAWHLLAFLASRDETASDALFEKRLAQIERTIHAAPNRERYVMNSALIAIGLRSAGLRKAALAAAKRIGKVEVDHGDTACKTPDAADTIAKAWAHARSKGFESPAAQERERETPRRRC